MYLENTLFVIYANMTFNFVSLFNWVLYYRPSWQKRRNWPAANCRSFDEFPPSFGFGEHSLNFHHHLVTFDRHSLNWSRAFSSCLSCLGAVELWSLGSGFCKYRLGRQGPWWQGGLLCHRQGLWWQDGLLCHRHGPWWQGGLRCHRVVWSSWVSWSGPWKVGVDFASRFCVTFVAKSWWATNCVLLCYYSLWIRSNNIDALW